MAPGVAAASAAVAPTMPTPRPGFIWVEVPAEAWTNLVAASRALDGFGDR